MIAIDTNVLAYARWEEAPHHHEAKSLLASLAEGEEPWALPWPCVYEFLRVVTHPRVFDPPTDLDAAVEDILRLFDSPTLVLLGEGPAHPEHVRRMVVDGRVAGNLAHDAHIAALCFEHGVARLLAADRDFTRFPGLDTKDPFVG